MHDLKSCVMVIVWGINTQKNKRVKSLMSNDDLRAKLERWLEPNPEMTTPLEVVTYATAMKRQINAENWGENEAARKRALLSLDSVCTTMYLHDAKRTNIIAFNDHAQMQIRLAIEHGVVNDRYVSDDFVKASNGINMGHKREFLRKARRLSQKLECPSFQLLNRKIEGTTRRDSIYHSHIFSNSILDHVNHLIEALNEVDHPLITEELSLATRPKDGPRNVTEMTICMMAAIEFCQQVTHGFELQGTKAPHLEDTIAAMAVFLGGLEEIQGDLPKEKLASFYGDAYENIVLPVLETHMVKLKHIFGLMDFYLAHSADKVSLDMRARLQAAYFNIHEGVYSDTVKDKGGVLIKVGDSEPSDAELNLFSNLAIDYPSPSVEEISENISAAIDQKYDRKPSAAQKNKDRFNSCREQLPVGMVECVTLHYPENVVARAARRVLFKREKPEFVKHLAGSKKDDLLCLGFSGTEISNMRKTGKLPEGCGYNVEHIVDREHGGTNHRHNFILMPEKINEAKNDLKQAQTRFLPDDGAWIISWVPEKNEDGTYPEIFMGSIDRERFEPEPRSFIGRFLAPLLG